MERFYLLCFLNKPCKECGTVWAKIRGTSKTKESAKCYPQGHSLTKSQSTLRVPWREAVRKHKEGLHRMNKT